MATYLSGHEKEGDEGAILRVLLMCLSTNGQFSKAVYPGDQIVSQA